MHSMASCTGSALWILWVAFSLILRVTSTVASSAAAPSLDEMTFAMEDGRVFRSFDAMVEGTTAGGWGQWYAEVKAMWDAVAAVNEGMLEGDRMANNNKDDLQRSLDFLVEFLPDKGKTKRKALDLGAGIGRVAKDVLGYFVTTIDLVEPDARLLWEAQRRLSGHNRYGSYVNDTVQHFTPTANTYDLICLQWLSLYLSDNDLLAVLQKAKAALAVNGVIFFKEEFLGLPDSGSSVRPKVKDHRIFRPVWYVQSLFEKAGLHVLKFKPDRPNSRVDLSPLVDAVGGEDHWNFTGAFALSAQPLTKISGSSASASEPSSPDKKDEELIVSGWDLAEGIFYPSVESMWKQQVGEQQWNEYNKKYWDEREAKINNPEIAEMDMRESTEFLRPYFDSRTRYQRRGLDLGAGVGRVSQGVLLKFVYIVDLVDYGKHFLHEARNRLYQVNIGGKYIHSSLQDFVPAKPAEYDLICLQYTSLYLSDADLKALLTRLVSAIKPTGLMFVKEPISKYEKFQINRDSGHNIVRARPHFEWLLTSSGWSIQTSEQQKNWVKEDNSNPVRMYILRPTGQMQKQQEAGKADEL